MLKRSTCVSPLKRWFYISRTVCSLDWGKMTDLPNKSTNKKWDTITGLPNKSTNKNGTNKIYRPQATNQTKRTHSEKYSPPRAADADTHISTTAGAIWTKIEPTVRCFFSFLYYPPHPRRFIMARTNGPLGTSDGGGCYSNSSSTKCLQRVRV